MINTTNIEQAKRKIKEETKPIIVFAQDDNFNRKMLEYGKFDVLLGIGMGDKKSSLRQIDSGFNHVLAAIASKNKISIGIDVESIRSLDKKNKAIILGRIKQNMQICKKEGVKIVFFNYKDKKDAFSLATSIGASSKQAKEAISF